MTGRPSRPTRLLHGRGEVGRPFPGRGGDDGRTATVPDGPDPLDEAYRRGFDDGRAAGERDALARTSADLEARTAEIGRALTTLAEIRTHLLHDAESRLLDITVEAASRIVRERIDDGDPVVARALREALDAAPKSGRLEARVHPDDVAAVREAMGDAIDAGTLDLIEDATVARGGCVVVTGVGTLDARVETAADLVRDALAAGEETS